jgi:hypothetical protein
MYAAPFRGAVQAPWNGARYVVLVRTPQSAREHGAAMAHPGRVPVPQALASPEARGYTPRFVPPVGIGGATSFS